MRTIGLTRPISENPSPTPTAVPNGDAHGPTAQVRPHDSQAPFRINETKHPTSLQPEEAVGVARSWKTLLWCLEGTVRVRNMCTGTLRNTGVRLNPAFPHTRGITSLEVSYTHTLSHHIIQGWRLKLPISSETERGKLKPALFWPCWLPAHPATMLIICVCEEYTSLFKQSPAPQPVGGNLPPLTPGIRLQLSS